jgi:outer membrane protein OmpA-like peptidoglycan-associated protein
VTVASLFFAGLAACATPPAPEPYAEAPVPTTPDRIVMLTVNFNFDSYAIRSESYALLDNVAMALNDRRLAGYHFDINGHTDIIGRLAYNIALSQLRAGAVASYLAARGVPRETMHVQGFGPLNLLDPGNPAGPANRRVEIVSVR